MIAIIFNVRQKFKNSATPLLGLPDWFSKKIFSRISVSSEIARIGRKVTKISVQTISKDTEHHVVRLSIQIYYHWRHG